MIGDGELGERGKVCVRLEVDSDNLHGRVSPVSPQKGVEEEVAETGRRWVELGSNLLGKKECSVGLYGV